MIPDKTNFKIFLMTLSMAALSACASPRAPAEARQDGETISSQTHIVQPTSMILIEFDADRDRLLTRSELLAGADAEWRVIAEAAGADELRPIDFSQWVEKAIGTKETAFTHIAVDTNANGTIGAYEFRSALEREFSIADKDKDGVVTRAELVKSFQVRQRQQSRPSRNQGERHQRGGGRRPPSN